MKTSHVLTHSQVAYIDVTKEEMIHLHKVGWNKKQTTASLTKDLIKDIIDGKIYCKKPLDEDSIVFFKEMFNSLKSNLQSPVREVIVEVI